MASLLDVKSEMHENGTEILGHKYKVRNNKEKKNTTCMPSVG